MEAVAEREGFSLGEFKLICCVASLTGLIRSWKSVWAKFGMGSMLWSTVWNVVKPKEFLRRLLDYRTTVLLPIFRYWVRQLF